MFKFEFCLPAFNFIFRALFWLGLSLPQFMEGGKKKSSSVLFVCNQHGKWWAFTWEALDKSLATIAGENLWELWFLVSLIKLRTIFPILFSCHMNTVNIKFQKKEKKIFTETAVFNIQPVYSGKLLEMEKFPFLFVFILDSCLVKTVFVNKGSLVLNSSD